MYFSSEPSRIFPASIQSMSHSWLTTSGLFLKVLICTNFLLSDKSLASNTTKWVVRPLKKIRLNDELTLKTFFWIHIAWWALRILIYLKHLFPGKFRDTLLKNSWLEACEVVDRDEGHHHTWASDSVRCTLEYTWNG